MSAFMAAVNGTTLRECKATSVPSMALASEATRDIFASSWLKASLIMPSVLPPLLDVLLDDLLGPLRACSQEPNSANELFG